MSRISCSIVYKIFFCSKFPDINFKLYGPFLWVGFNCLKATEPLQGDSLLFTTKFPEIPGTHLIDLGRIKGWVDLGATQWFLYTGPVDWESRALTTRPLLHYFRKVVEKKMEKTGKCKSFCFSKKHKETSTQVFRCEYCEIFKNTYFKEYLRTTAAISWKSTCSKLTITRTRCEICSKLIIKKVNADWINIAIVPNKWPHFFREAASVLRSTQTGFSLFIQYVIRHTMQKWRIIFITLL